MEWPLPERQQVCLLQQRQQRVWQQPTDYLPQHMLLQNTAQTQQPRPRGFEKRSPSHVAPVHVWPVTDAEELQVGEGPDLWVNRAHALQAESPGGAIKGRPKSVLHHCYRLQLLTGIRSPLGFMD